MKNVFKFAMPFLQASLVKQILVGLILGIIVAYAAPSAAVSLGFLGKVFVTALKAVAPILVFVLVMSSIANQNLEEGENAHIKPIIVLYLIGTFAAAVVAVIASFMFPTKLILATTEAVSAPGAISEVLGNLILNVVDNPVRAIANGNYIGILAWAIAMGIVLRHGTDATREVLNDASKGVELWCASSFVLLQWAFLAWWQKRLLRRDRASLWAMSSCLRFCWVRWLSSLSLSIR